MLNKFGISPNIRADFSAGLVVFLVALPLCLGIALASGAPLLSGIISGIIGGIVVGLLSNSHLSVSGPAAGLTAIVIMAQKDLGSFQMFLNAVILAGVFQVFFSILKAGSISKFIPNQVIEGMLASIGLIIIIKQIPHILGYDEEFLGNESFFFDGNKNTITFLLESFKNVSLGALIISIVSLLILIFWEKITFFKKLNLIPGALIAVIVGILINEIFYYLNSDLYISKEHLVSLPSLQSIADLKQYVVLPKFDINSIFNVKLLVTAISIAVIASIETLLCVEAADRMDVLKRTTDTNIELRAQGIGNVLSGFLGGLPMTSVVVRSSANATAGAKTKMATIIHGFLLLLSIIFISPFLNKIPFATLASILVLVGYKLTKPSIFIDFYKKGSYQFLPFIVTVIAVIFFDLLRGVALGLLLYFILNLISKYSKSKL